MSNSLKQKAVSGVAWTSVERFTQQIIQFVIGVAIARILAPQDYGIIGMTAIFFAVATTFIDSGFGSALIQRKIETRLIILLVFTLIFLLVLSYMLYFGLLLLQ